MAYNVWTFENCTVYEVDGDYDLHCFEVEIAKGNERRKQTIYPKDLNDMKAIQIVMDEGFSPLDGGEDGLGNLVCWENAN